MHKNADIIAENLPGVKHVLELSDLKIFSGGISKKSEEKHTVHE